MSFVWSILALIIGIVVAYLMYEEFVVGRENAEETEVEKEIQEDLVELAVESGMTDAVDALPDRTAVSELADAEPVDAVAEIEAPVAAAVVAAEEIADVVEEEPAEVAEEVESFVEEPAIEEPVIEERVAVAAVDVAEPQDAPQPDDLTKIKGIGKVYAQRLNEAGITTYAQVVETDVAALEEVTKAIPAANAHDWSRQAQGLLDG